MNRNFRMTPARSALFEIFSGTTVPLTVAKITSALSDRNINVNKTTVYRELNFFLKQGKITEVIINSGKKFYESTESEHHHHLICSQCGDIRDVILENDLKEEEIKIKKGNGFKIQKHSLEFFGLCVNCQ